MRFMLDLLFNYIGQRPYNDATTKTAISILPRSLAACSRFCLKVEIALAQCMFLVKDDDRDELSVLNGHVWSLLIALVVVLARVSLSGQQIVQRVCAFEDPDEVDDDPHELYWQLDGEVLLCILFRQLGPSAACQI